MPLKVSSDSRQYTNSCAVNLNLAFPGFNHLLEETLCPANEPDRIRFNVRPSPEYDCEGSSYVATYRCQDVVESPRERGSNV